MLPDLEKEMEFFRRNPFNPGEEMDVDTLLQFTVFDKQDVATIEGKDDEGVDHVVEIKKIVESSVEGNVVYEEYQVWEDGVMLGEASGHIEHNEFYGLTNYYYQVMQSSFNPPQFAITMLGTSHGFDPCGTTTGFILWVNRRGLMIDPPPFSGDLLRLNGIPSRLIDGVILTHCHADHDAGTFQRILAEHQIMVITTKTIMGSFLRKYSAISGKSQQFLKKLFSFRSARIGERLSYHGGELNFFYSLHSIPCVGFEAYYGGKSLVYSADTMNDPERIKQMQADGWLHEKRAQQLLDFPWHHDLILHEAGVPPIHTPITTLQALDDDIKERLYAVHIAAKDVKDKGIKYPECGPENTIEVSGVDPISSSEAIEVLDLASGIQMFNSFSLVKAKKILEMAKTTEFEAGDVILECNDPSEFFYIIASGIVALEKEHAVPKYLSIGDYFGECSIYTCQSRYLVRAETNVMLVTISNNDMMHLLYNTPVVPGGEELILDRLNGVGENRNIGSWELITHHGVFETLSASQRTHLEYMMQLVDVQQGEVLWESGDEASFAVFIFDAVLEVELHGVDEPRACYTGCFVGDVKAMMATKKTTTSSKCVVKTAGKVWKMDKEELVGFFSQNPGVLMPMRLSICID
eukprot:TRINITY_DN7690_c0_g1_i1.p1 TRINITY_DN7690_c0_g1~~TRINITY_DN7690_c0_g1_i1.p1  ORF type:complete len:635 (-),score=225.39 TRINITY_DN7690_c0_g1_i1:139-2043(-)